MSTPHPGEKTEKASPQKLRKAREKGQVARSRDWAGAVGILVCLQLVLVLTPQYLEDFRTLFSQSLRSLEGVGTLEDTWSQLFPATMLLLLKLVLPLLVVPLAIGLASLFPGGWVLSGTPLIPRLDRLNPLSYFKRVFSAKHLGETLIAFAKAATILAVLYYLARSGVDDYGRLTSLPMQEALSAGAKLMMGGLMTLCAVFVAFALIDLPMQRFLFLRDQRMSKQEVKEEHKINEGRPEVRQRIRQLQHQIARRGIRKAVPEADVVIVNPEHYAVALKYDEKRAAAPFVVAKGIDELALFIRQVATEHGVEVVSMPPLARAIYNTSQVHQQIPAALYAAVARVLSYVMQIQAFRAGRRSTQPSLPADLPVPRHLSD
ncbi:MAG: flagellar type III secretion system protein FlhB [Steroidobacteraceae bacterium]|nr:flagellar type III secretion system protein FlhB [Steroidobacteraceae bacterium]